MGNSGEGSADGPVQIVELRGFLMLRRLGMLRWPVLLLLWQALAADPQPGLETVIEQVSRAYQSGEAMRVMNDVYASDRYFTFPHFHDTAEYLRKRMAASGLSNVDLGETPGDGVS